MTMLVFVSEMSITSPIFWNTWLKMLIFHSDNSYPNDEYLCF